MPAGEDARAGGGAAAHALRPESTPWKAAADDDEGGGGAGEGGTPPPRRAETPRVGTRVRGRTPPSVRSFQLLRDDPDPDENASPNVASFERLGEALSRAAAEGAHALKPASSGPLGEPLLTSVCVSDASGGAPEYASPSGSGGEAAQSGSPRANERAGGVPPARYANAAETPWTAVGRLASSESPGSALMSHELTPGATRRDGLEDDATTSARIASPASAARALLPLLSEDAPAAAKVVEAAATPPPERPERDGGDDAASNAGGADATTPLVLAAERDVGLPALTPPDASGGAAEAEPPPRRLTFAPEAHSAATPAPRGMAGKRAQSMPPPPPPRLSIPALPLSRAITDRIETLGKEMPPMQKVILWLGIVLDLLSKMSLLRETYRFASFKEWNWFIMVFLFFCMSGCMTCTYWLCHYTWKPADRRKSLDARHPEPVIFGYTKNDFKKMVRNIGAVFAALQLGTAFSAFRALRTKEVKQRLIELELRGMRLVDTLCLTLSLSLLQVYLGIKCSSPEISCPGRTGFDYILLFSVCSSLVSATLCFISLDMRDEVRRNRRLIAEIVVFFLYRVTELSSRVATLALFAATCGPYVFLFLFAHAAAVLILLRFPVYAPDTLRHVWSKVARTTDWTVRCFWDGKTRTFRVPVADDVKLLAICLAWPPSCYVSDATDSEGRFWWRMRMAPRKGFAVLGVPSSLIPWPVYFLLTATESGVLLLTITTYAKPWMSRYLLVAAVVTFLWLVCSCNLLAFHYIWRPDHWGKVPSHLAAPEGVAADAFAVTKAADGEGDERDGDGDRGAAEEAVSGAAHGSAARQSMGGGPVRADLMRQSDATLAMATPAKRALEAEARMRSRGNDAVSSSVPPGFALPKPLLAVREVDVSIDVASPR